MTNIDERIATALQHDAPPPRDPMFRIQLLERRERQRFRRRALQALAGGVAVLAVSAAIDQPPVDLRAGLKACSYERTA